MGDKFMTEVYLIRHSEKYRNFNNIINDDSFQLFNEKIILSINGEMLANKLANMEEMSNIDVVFASNYVRSIGTAKYIAYRNKIDVNIDKNFGERIYGINSVDGIMDNFNVKQWNDIDYKLPNGESRRDVTNRMYNALIRVINDYKNKRIAIVSHGTAISFLLDKWCDVFVNYNNDNKMNTKIVFKNKIIFDNNISAPCVFKIVFDDNNIISIENINIH
jgi:2,3-bisphosphoglycerate-dependent phosphoglycerate mutase